MVNALLPAAIRERAAGVSDGGCRDAPPTLLRYTLAPRMHTARSNCNSHKVNGCIWPHGVADVVGAMGKRVGHRGEDLRGWRGDKLLN